MSNVTNLFDKMSHTDKVNAECRHLKKTLTVCPDPVMISLDESICKELTDAVQSIMYAGMELKIAGRDDLYTESNMAALKLIDVINTIEGKYNGSEET